MKGTPDAEAKKLADPYGMLLEALDAPALAFDSSGSVLAINEPAETLLGVTKSFIVGQGVELTNSLYVTTEIRQARKRAVFSERRSWRGDWTKIHQSGQEIPARVRVVPVPGTKAYLEVIRPSEEPSSTGDLERQLMSQLVEMAPVPLAIVDFENSILYGNPSFEQLANRGKRIPAGTPLARYFETADYLRLFSVSASRAGRTLVREPSQLSVGEGRGRPVRVTTSDVNDPSGRMMFRLLAVEDTAELEGAREDAALLLEASRHVDEAVLFSDPAGALFFANEAANKMLGIDEEAVVGAQVATLFGPEAMSKIGAAQDDVEFVAEVSAGKRARSLQVTAFPVPGRDGRQMAWGWVARVAAKPRAKKATPAGRKTER